MSFNEEVHKRAWIVLAMQLDRSWSELTPDQKMEAVAEARRSVQELATFAAEPGAVEALLASGPHRRVDKPNGSCVVQWGLHGDLMPPASPPTSLSTGQVPSQRSSLG